VHSFGTLKALEVFVNNRVTNGMHYIQRYSELAAELTESVCDHIAPDVSPLVKSLELPVWQLLTAMHRTMHDEEKERTNETDITESTDTASEVGELESDDENEIESSDSGELLIRVLLLTVAFNRPKLCVICLFSDLLHTEK